MADITTSTKLHESTRDVVYAFQYQYVDTGNESAVLKIDVSGLTKSANGDTCSGIRIVECWWVVKNMTVEILADASTDVIIMHLDENQSGYQDFSSFGGLPDSSDYGSSGTGDIKFTTTGAGAAGDAYQIVIRGIKQY
jgi:hypothetical protein